MESSRPSFGFGCSISWRFATTSELLSDKAAKHYQTMQPWEELKVQGNAVARMTLPHKFTFLHGLMLVTAAVASTCCR